MMVVEITSTHYPATIDKVNKVLYVHLINVERTAEQTIWYNFFIIVKEKMSSDQLRFQPWKNSNIQKTENIEML
jgi:hypothetical protein